MNMFFFANMIDSLLYENDHNGPLNDIDSWAWNAYHTLSLLSNLT